MREEIIDVNIAQKLNVQMCKQLTAIMESSTLFYKTFNANMTINNITFALGDNQMYGDDRALIYGMQGLGRYLAGADCIATLTTADAMPLRQYSHVHCYAVKSVHIISIEPITTTKLWENMDFVREALKYDAHVMMKFIPEHIRSPAIYEDAVRASGLAIRHVPVDFITHDLAMIALSKYPFDLKNIPTQLRTHELCEFALKRFPENIRAVPMNVMTEKMCIGVVSANRHMLGVIPKNFLSRSVYMEAVRAHVEAAKYIDFMEAPNEFVRELLTINPHAEKFVPKHVLGRVFGRVSDGASDKAADRASA